MVVTDKHSSLFCLIIKDDATVLQCWFQVVKTSFHRKLPSNIFFGWTLFKFFYFFNGTAHFLNGRESAVDRVLDGTYPS
jgi:hypothetical protein